MVMFPFYCSFDDKHEREEVDGYDRYSSKIA